MATHPTEAITISALANPENWAPTFLNAVTLETTRTRQLQHRLRWDNTQAISGYLGTGNWFALHFDIYRPDGTFFDSRDSNGYFDACEFCFTSQLPNPFTDPSAAILQREPTSATLSFRSAAFFADQLEVNRFYDMQWLTGITATPTDTANLRVAIHRSTDLCTTYTCTQQSLIANCRVNEINFDIPVPTLKIFTQPPPVTRCDIPPPPSAKETWYIYLVNIVKSLFDD